MSLKSIHEVAPCGFLAFVALLIPGAISGSALSSSPPPVAPTPAVLPIEAPHGESSEATTIGWQRHSSEEIVSFEVGPPTDLLLEELPSEPAPRIVAARPGPLVGRLLQHQGFDLAATRPAWGAGRRQRTEFPLSVPWGGDPTAEPGVVWPSFEGLESRAEFYPNPAIAVGPSHVLQVTESGLAVYSKLGRQVRGFTRFSSFWAPVLPAGWAGLLLEPQVVYLPRHGRFAALAVGHGNSPGSSALFLAVSRSWDPMHPWWLWRLDSLDGESNLRLAECALGADSWRLAITCNVYRDIDGRFAEARLWTIEPSILFGAPARGWVFRNLRWASDDPAFAVRPAISLSQSHDRAFFLVNSFAGSGRSLLLWRLRAADNDDGPPALDRRTVDLGRYSGSAVELDSGIRPSIDFGDARIAGAAYSRRRLFLVLTATPSATVDASGWLLAEIDVDRGTRGWQHLIWGGPGVYYLYPALALSSGLGSAPPIAIVGSWAWPAAGLALGGLHKVVTNPADGDDGTFVAHQTKDPIFVSDPLTSAPGGFGSSGAAWDWDCRSFWGSFAYAVGEGAWSTRIEAIPALADTPPCPLIDVVEPNSPEKVALGRRRTIRWRHANLDADSELFVWYTADGGRTWTPLAGPLPTSAKALDWIPDEKTEDGKIWVGAWTDAGWAAGDWSDGRLTVDLASDHLLRVYRAPSGSGSISSTPSGISCGSDCRQDYAVGTEVELEANPAAGAIFVRWEGDCSGTEPTVSVTMDGDRVCTAIFAGPYRLSVTKIGSGYGTVVSAPPGINCGSDCRESYDIDQVVSLSAVPAADSVFVRWEGDCSGSTSSTPVTMTRDMTCTAVFDGPIWFWVAKEGTGSGTITSNPSGINCGSDCASQYEDGTGLDLTATPAALSTFTGWSGDPDCTDGTVTVDSEKTCFGTFNGPLWLWVVKEGIGSGTVSSNPSGISCGADCAERYAQGAAVELTATPSVLSTFVGWSGDPDCADGIVTVDAEKTCEANFAPSARLSVARAGLGSGTVTSNPTGISCGADCREDYVRSSTVTLTATPGAGWSFDGWSGDCSGSSPTIAVTVDRDKTCIARFGEEGTVLSVAVAGNGTGSVSSSPSGINCPGGTCRKVYAEGQEVTLTAWPGTQLMSFAGWSGDCSGTELTTTVRIDGDRTCLATFDPPVKLHVTLDGEGSGSVSSDPSGINCWSGCTASYKKGQEVTLSARPTTHLMTFAGWSGDCTGTESTVTIQMDGEKTCSATFRPPLKLHITLAGDGSGSVSSDPSGINCWSGCTASYKEGQEVTLTAWPGSHLMTFAGWSGDCAGTELSATVSVDSEKTCVATFNPPVHLNVTVEGQGTGSVSSDPSGINCGSSCTKLFKRGESVTLTAWPSTQMRFAGWSDGCTGTDKTVDLVIDDNTTCRARFDQGALLQIVKEGTGSGTVTSDPRAIDCGVDCSEIFYGYMTLTLTATPDPDSIWVGYSSDSDPDCLDGVVTTNASRTCRVIFSKTSMRLTVEKTGTGSGRVTSTPAGIDCGADCVGLFDEFTLVALSAEPDPDSIFTGWSGDPDCADGQVLMNADKSCTAVFEALRRTLAVTKTGDGSGTVTSDPPGIDCGSDCSEEYEHGQIVSLSALADPGSTFTGWNGHLDCADGQVSMTTSRTCTANFDEPGATLSVLLTGDGLGTVASDPAGIACGVDCTEVYDEGTSVALTASAAPGSEFLHWSGGCAGSDESTMVVMNGDKTCTATFGRVRWILSVSRVGSDSGRVTSDPAGIDCGVDCAHDYLEGATVRLTATPTAGSSFAGWSGDCAGSSADAEVVIDGSKTCIATFTALPRLTVLTAGSGAGQIARSPLGETCGRSCSAYPQGTAVTLTASPAAGSSFVGWSGDCAGAESAFVVIMDADKSCTATFAMGIARLKVLKRAVGRPGSGTVTSEPAGIDCGTDCSEEYAYGTQVTLTASPAGDSVFTSWTGHCHGTEPLITVTMDTHRTCTARFDFVDPLLRITKRGSGTGSVLSSPEGIGCGADCIQSFPASTEVTLTATPGPDSVFVAWNGDCTGSLPTVVLALDFDVTCSARFEARRPALTVSMRSARARGSGVVLSEPSGIVCGDDCEEQFDLNSWVVLSASPDPGSQFSSWGGDCSGSNSIVAVQVDGDKLCAANFIPTAEED